MKQYYPIVLCGKEEQGSRCTTIRIQRRRAGLSNTAHSGPTKRDKQKVFKILIQLLSGTPAWMWISSHEKAKNGKRAFEALQNHYDGPGQVEKRLAYAYGILTNTYYKSE